jgi:Fur family iron response transcriptional regulator
VIFDLQRDPHALERVLARAKAAGLALTKQRRELVALLFGAGERHVTPEALHAEARAAGARVSRATVYNVLHKLTEAGLVKEIRIEHGRTFYDTDTSPHYHLYFEDTGEIHSIPADLKALGHLPRILGGIDRERLDVVIRVRVHSAPISDRLLDESQLSGEMKK